MTLHFQTGSQQLSAAKLPKSYVTTRLLGLRTVCRSGMPEFERLEIFLQKQAEQAAGRG
jgi:hypothetical protein